MTSQLVACPQCDAPLALMPDQGFCQCAYCGVKFVVDLASGTAPRLARFESVLSAPPGTPPLRDVQQRLADLELTLADAEDDAEDKQAELDETKSAYWQARVNLQRLVAPLQNTTYVAGLLALLAAFATLFVFRRAERLPGAAIALLLAVTGWAFHREWRDTEEEGQAECQEAREAIRETRAELNDALARLEAQGLERELLQKQVLAASPEPAAGSPAEASVP